MFCWVTGPSIGVNKYITNNNNDILLNSQQMQQTNSIEMHVIDFVLEQR